jgi:hypothetical protein
MDAAPAPPELELTLPEPAPEPDPTTLGRVEGRVLDTRTGRGLVGIDVVVSGACQRGGMFASAYTDQLGRFQLEMPAGECTVEGSYGDATTGEHSIRIEAQRTLTVDLEIDPRALAAALAKDPPENCPGSKRHEVIVGNQPSQRDLDDTVREVLDGGNVPDQRASVVRAEIEGGRTVSASALPEAYVLQTRAELEAEAKRTNADVWHIAFYELHATATCARVAVGGNFVQPRRKLKTCCCTAHDFYEKRRGKWKFVKRIRETCA